VDLLRIIVVVPQLFVFAGLVTALAFAIARRGTLGRAATLAISGLSLLVLNAILGMATQLLVNVGFIHHRLPQGDYMTFLALLSGVSGLVWAAGTGLVIVAVFFGRKVVTPDPGQTSRPAGPLV
jgi:hypothetical protein